MGNAIDLELSALSRKLQVLGVMEDLGRLQLDFPWIDS
jgi:hypothetical protein